MEEFDILPDGVVADRHFRMALLARVGEDFADGRDGRRPARRRGDVIADVLRDETGVGVCVGGVVGLEDGAAVLGVLNVAERLFEAKVDFRRILGEVEFEAALCLEYARVVPGFCA